MKKSNGAIGLSLAIMLCAASLGIVSCKKKSDSPPPTNSGGGIVTPVPENPAVPTLDIAKAGDGFGLVVSTPALIRRHRLSQGSHPDTICPRTPRLPGAFVEPTY